MLQKSFFYLSGLMCCFLVTASVIQNQLQLNNEQVISTSSPIKPIGHDTTPSVIQDEPNKQPQKKGDVVDSTAKVIHITSKKELDDLVASGKLMIVDVYAPWCGPCKKVAPEVEKLAAAMPHVLVAKLNGDEHRFVGAYGVKAFPTFLIFKDGKRAKIFSGSRSFEQLKQELESCSR